MIPDADLVICQRVGSPFSSRPTSRVSAEGFVAYRARSGEEWEIVPVPSCRCCGEPAWANLRCTKHQGRNPCVVPGCKRTAKATEGRKLSDDAVICGEHWRAYVPPRSLARRAYHRHFARAKRYGWSPESEAKFRRFWLTIVARVKARASGGHLDQREIERLFGWDGKS